MSTTWINNLYGFINRIKKDPQEFSKSMQTNRILVLYFNYDSNSENYIGSYPGPINNFSAFRFCDNWRDPVDEEANQYIAKGLREREDFIILKEDVYLKLKNVFGANFEIKRQLISDNNEKMIELYLQEVHSIN